MSGYTLLTPFYLTNVLGYRPREIGLLMVALPISLGIAAPVSGALSDRIGSRPVTVVGLLTLTSGTCSVLPSSASTQRHSRFWR